MATKKSSKSSSARQARRAARDAVENKTAKVIALLRREGGATLAEITGATGWLPHSARAALTGVRKKGHTIEKSKADGVTRWTIAAEQPA